MLPPTSISQNNFIVSTKCLRVLVTKLHHPCEVIENAECVHLVWWEDSNDILVVKRRNKLFFFIFQVSNKHF